MRIGFDARILYGVRRGMWRYTHTLLETLIELAPQHHYILYSDRELPIEFGDHPNLEIRLLSPQRLWANTALPRATKADDLDLIHFPSNTCWARAACPTVVTLHDVNPLLDARFGWRNRLLYLGYLTMMSLAARQIITVSHASRHIIQRYCPPLAGRLTTIHNGLSEPYASGVNLDPLPWAEVPTLLFVGGCDPNKNLLMVIRALAALKPTIPSGLYLRIVGDCSETAYQAQIQAEIKTHQLEDCIQWLGRIDDATLLKEYQQATVFVFPSFREGFGFPVLEAMACGTPVIAGNTTSLPEIIGEAGLLVDPNEVDDLTQALQTVLLDRQVAQSLATQGKKQAQRFTWSEAARQTLAVYQIEMSR